MNRQAHSFFTHYQFRSKCYWHELLKDQLCRSSQTQRNTNSVFVSLIHSHTQSVTDLLQGMVMSAGLALPCYERPGGELVVVEQADDHHHHHRHHHDDDDDLNKLQFSCTNKQREREGLASNIYKRYSNFNQ